MWGNFQSTGRVSNSTEKKEMFMHRYMTEKKYFSVLFYALCTLQSLSKGKYLQYNFFPLSNAWSCPVTWWLRESNLEQTSNLTMFCNIPERIVPIQDVHAKSNNLRRCVFTHPFSGSRYDICHDLKTYCKWYCWHIVAPRCCLLQQLTFYTLKLHQSTYGSSVWFKGI